MYLVDTDWIIDYLKGRKETVKILQALFDKGLCISIISIAEIYEGMVDARNKEELLKTFYDFLDSVIVLGLDMRTCVKFGELRNTLRKKGELIGDFDIIIASTAITNNAEIITNNIAHFSKIKDARLWKK